MIKIPTTKELYDDIVSDLENELGVSIPLFGKNFIRVLAGVQAAKLKLYYLAIGFLQKNLFVDTADPESMGGTLERFGRIKLGRDPFPPQASQYVVQVTGTIGSTIKANQTFKSDDESFNPGVLFILDDEYTLVTATDYITIRCLIAGLDGKLDIFNTLTATSPIAGVDKSVMVTAIDTDPLDGEDIEEYRNKIEESFRLETQGGAGTDYRLWSLDAQGVKQTYPYAKSGGFAEINLYVEANEADSTDGKGTPTAGILTEVESVINTNPDDTLTDLERGRRPINDIVYYLPVTPLDVLIEINGYVNLTTDKETKIINEVLAFVNSVRPYVSTADTLANKNDIIDRNNIISNILTATPGAIFTSVTININTVDYDTYSFENGDIPYIESAFITFT